MKSPPTIAVQLVHIHGPLKGEIQEFSGVSISIGRNPDSSVCFPVDMTALSRRHAEIRRVGNQFMLTDCSANGTFLNGKKIKEASLKDGDVLEFSEGGPKVSFLTRIVEGQAEMAVPASAPEAMPEPVVKVGPPPVESRPPAVEVAPPVESPPIPVPAPLGDHHSPSSPRTEKPVDLSTQKVAAPLVIQYGPVIRSFRELPITVGKQSKVDFVLPLPGVVDQHMQILFIQGQYWVKDLSGQNLIRVNGNPIDFQAQLRLNDIVSLTAQGPSFCFLGEGRLAEFIPPAAETPSDNTGEKNTGTERGESHEKKSTGSLWSKLKSKF